MGQAEYEGKGKPEVVYGKPSMALVEPWLCWWHGKAYDRSDQQTFESWKLDEIGRTKCEVTTWTLERCLPEWLKIQQINIQQLSSFICVILVLRRSWAGYTLIWWRWGAVPSQSHRPQMPQLLHQKGCCRCWHDTTGNHVHGLHGLGVPHRQCVTSKEPSAGVSCSQRFRSFAATNLLAILAWSIRKSWSLPKSICPWFCFCNISRACMLSDANHQYFSLSTWNWNEDK